MAGCITLEENAKSVLECDHLTIKDVNVDVHINHP